MKRWIVFDSPTAEAARHQGGDTEVRADHPVAEVLLEAVHSGHPVVLVVPAGPERATVARITPPQRSTPKR